MSETACRISANEEQAQPDPAPVWWIYLWVAWGMLGATALIALDRNWIAASLWLVAGGLIGIIGPRVGRLVGRHFFETTQRMWENPHELRVDPGTFEITYDDGYINGEVAKSGLFVAPAFGLFYGFLLGPFIGVLASWERAEPGWSGAIEGLVIWWVIISFIAAIAAAVMCPRVHAGGPRCGPPWWMYVASPIFGVAGIVNCTLALIRLPIQRRIYRQLENRGAAFGWDGVSVFHGINFRSCRVTDDDLKVLPWFPELDHLDLSGSPVTDAGIPYVGRLKCLSLLYLSNTQVTDAGVRGLLRLNRLRHLDLRWTAATEEALASLRRAMPRPQIASHESKTQNDSQDRPSG